MRDSSYFDSVKTQADHAGWIVAGVILVISAIVAIALEISNRKHAKKL